MSGIRLGSPLGSPRRPYQRRDFVVGMLATTVDMPNNTIRMEATDRTSYRVCPLCEATCGLEISTRGREVIGIRGDEADVFSKGFQFESITGNAQIVNGLLLTNDMKLTGTGAKVTMTGQVDMNRETQDLKVRILPTIGDNVSLLSFAAGPVVGVGVLLANKILREPLDKLVSFEYNVSGSWADPKVEKAGQSKPAQGGVVPGE